MAAIMVIGDDLTGANATGALYAKTGLTVITVKSLDVATRIRNDVDVLVINTGSRHLDPEAAAARVQAIVERAAQWNIQVVKRIDTTLRGNIGAELAAGLSTMRAQRPHERHVALVVPAFPSSGRVTIGGQQLVDGIPVHRSWAAHDPLDPVRHSTIAAIIAEQARDLSITEIPLDELDRDLSHHLAQAAATSDVIVVDAMSDNDIALVAKAAHLASQNAAIHWLVIDTGPFGATLARVRRADLIHEHAPTILVIAGSLTKESRAQLDYLEADGAALITIDPATARASRILDRMQESVHSGHSIVGVRTCIPEGDTDAAATEATLHLLGIIARSAVEKLRPAGIYATGGDVSMAVLEALHGGGLRIQDEVLPLAVIGAISGGPFSGLGLATKGGLIGGPDAAYACVSALQRASRQAMATHCVEVVVEER